MKGCKSKGNAAECSFTDKSGTPIRIVYTLSDRAATFATKGAKTQCDVLGTCTPLSGKKLRTAGPVLLK